MRARTGRICFVPHAREEIAVCVCVCVHVWTLASSMDAPAKHHLRLWCQETVAFVWRQTAQYDLAGGALSLSLSFCISRPLLLYHFFSACLALLPLFFLILYCFSHHPKISLYYCRVVTRKRKNQKDHNTLLFVRFPRHQLELKHNLVILDSPVSINTILHQIGAILTLFYETGLCWVPSLWLLRAKAACAHFP